MGMRTHLHANFASRAEIWRGGRNKGKCCIDFCRACGCGESISANATICQLKLSAKNLRRYLMLTLKGEGG